MLQPPTIADVHSYSDEYDFLALVESFDDEERFVRWGKNLKQLKYAAKALTHLHDPARMPSADRDTLLDHVRAAQPIALIWSHKRVSALTGLPLRYRLLGAKDEEEIGAGFGREAFVYSLPTDPAAKWTNRQILQGKIGKLEFFQINVLPVGIDVINKGALVKNKVHRRQTAKRYALEFVRKHGFYSGYYIIWKGKPREIWNEATRIVPPSELASRLESIFAAKKPLPNLIINKDS